MIYVNPFSAVLASKIDNSKHCKNLDGFCWLKNSIYHSLINVKPFGVVLASKIDVRLLVKWRTGMPVTVAGEPCIPHQQHISRIVYELVIEILWKIYVVFIWRIIIWSGHKFARDMYKFVTKLGCYNKIFRKISQDYYLKNCLWNGTMAGADKGRYWVRMSLGKGKNYVIWQHNMFLVKSVCHTLDWWIENFGQFIICVSYMTC